MKYRVYLETGASASVTVNVPDGLDPEEAREQAIDKALGAAPNICAQCSGWGSAHSLDLGEWDLSKDENGNDLEPELVEE